MAVLHWSARYVGAPFVPGGRDVRGLDCWGLISSVYQDVLSIPLPSFSGLYVTAEERRQIAALVAGEESRGPWREIERGTESEFDVALFNVFCLPTHVGIVVAPGRMLHATAGATSRVERYTAGLWEERLVAIYRHEAVGR